MQWKCYVVSSDQGEWEKNTSDKILAKLIKLSILSILRLFRSQLLACYISFQFHFKVVLINDFIQRSMSPK